MHEEKIPNPENPIDLGSIFTNKIKIVDRDGNEREIELPNMELLKNKDKIIQRDGKWYIQRTEYKEVFRIDLNDNG